MERTSPVSVSGGSGKRRLAVLVAILLVAGYASLAQAVGAADSPQATDGGPVGGTGDGGSGGAHPFPGVPDDSEQVGPVGRVSEALREDLEGVAQEEGISLEEAIRRYGWHNDFSALVHGIRTAFPADFSAAAIGDDDKPWISFAGVAPGAAVAAIGAFAVPVRIIEGRAFTESEMKLRLYTIHSSVVSDDRVMDAVSGYDIENGTFDVTVQLSDGEDVGPMGVVNELREALPDSIDSLDLDIEFRVVSHPLEEQDELVGGGVHIISDDDRICTAGFVIENSRGARNITTAGHCRNRQTINDIDFDDPIRLTFRGAHEGRWGDVQRHSVPSGHSLVNTIRYDSGRGDFRFITATGVPTPGQWLRKYGRTTGLTSDRVYRINQCAAGYCGLVMMHNDKSKGGDSGGPWFYGSTAYGIHSGPWWWLKVRDVFTPVDHIDEALGDWEVATS